VTELGMSQSFGVHGSLDLRLTLRLGTEMAHDPECARRAAEARPKSDIKVRGKWRYLYHAIDKHRTPVDFPLTAKRDLQVAKRFFRKMLQDPAAALAGPDRHGYCRYLFAGLPSFPTVWCTIQAFEAMLWLRKVFGFSAASSVREQNRLLAL
jgi:hypothetical protein